MRLFIIPILCIISGFQLSFSQVYIAPGGKVGIGVETPTAKLQVNSYALPLQPSIAIYDSSFLNQGGGIFQFRSVPNPDNYFNIRGALGFSETGDDSSLEYSFRNSSIMSLTGGVEPEHKLIYHAGLGAIRTGRNLYFTPMGQYSIAMGNLNTASGAWTTAIGTYNSATAESAVALGSGCGAEEFRSLAFGNSSYAQAPLAIAIGNSSVANDSMAITLGTWVHASGKRSLATGYLSTASGNTATATGFNTVASGNYSFSSGYLTSATAFGANSFGQQTKALAPSASAFGTLTTASGGSSMAINAFSKAASANSFAAGFGTLTTGYGAASFGEFTRARSYFSAVFGAYNDSIATSSLDTWQNIDPLFIIGNGLSDVDRNNAFTIYKSGILLAKNPSLVIADPGIVQLPISGSGTRMMWIPAKSAFRVGSVIDTQWDAGEIGTWSFASGYNTNSFGIGATAMGIFCHANGNAALAFGSTTNSTGDYTVGIGYANNAEGDYSVCLGSYTRTYGNNTHAFGAGVEADTYGSMALGSYNHLIGGSLTTWNGNDPLLYVGNGADYSSKSNAMVIYKNGNADINGFARLGEATESAPAIKMKQLPVTDMSATYNGNVGLPHGLNSSKIISVSVLVEYNAGSFAPPAVTATPGLNYNYTITSTVILLQNNTPSGPGDCYICGQPAKVLITYVE